MYREDVIVPLIKGKIVLDCGGIDHWAMKMKQDRGDWLHAIIADHAKSVIGVDILEENVNEINSQGKYNFVVANVEHLPFRDQFEVVVAGEIVEHIYNMGLFLDSAWEALHANGLLIITTPNNNAISNVLYAMALGKENCHPEHTCYYSKQTLTYIVEKHGFKIQAFFSLSRPARSRIVKFLRDAIIKIRPALAEQLVLVAYKLPEQKKYDDKW
jgi:ubiquinone/menaquinone biosynthesis C-methylase UbiE